MSEAAIRFLSVVNVLRVHEDTIAHEGGAAGLRDEGLLASAVEMPRASFGGDYLHADLAEMAAAYLFHICQNHAFMDGNKRTAAFSALLFLYLNGVEEDILPDAGAFEVITLKVASSELSKSDVTMWMRERVC